MQTNNESFKFHFSKGTNKKLSIQIPAITMGEEGKVHIIHLLSIRFHVWFHVTFDDLCCKQTPKVWTVICSLPHTVLVRSTSRYFNFALQSRQVKCTPQDSSNELNIWKMNPLIVPVTIVKFKSAFLHAQWAVNILRELPCIWSDWKSLNGLNLLEDIYIKFWETELVEIS